jgi:hypothetical protein
MRRMMVRVVAAVVAVSFALGAGHAQDKGAPRVVRVPVSPVPGDANASAALAQMGYTMDSVAPVKDAATVDQIHEYLRVSGEANAYRTRWIAALDKDYRSIAAPYWPESFRAAIQAEMQQSDLTPMYIVILQHGVSKGLMQDVLDTYRRVGATLFVASPACFRLGNALAAVAADTDKLRLAETLGTITKVYAGYKPQIAAARAQYLAEHPGYAGK